MARVVCWTGMLAMVFVGAACEKGGGAGEQAAAPVGDAVDGAIATMAKIADEACACRDLACSEAALAKMSAIKEPPTKPSKAQMEAAMKVAEKMAECQKQLMSAAAAGGSRLVEADVDVARLRARKLAFEAYPQWSMTPSNAGKCPTVADLADFLEKPAILTDPWGNPYLIRCGADLPAGARDIAIASSGPDGQPGTADDVMSWEP